MKKLLFVHNTVPEYRIAFWKELSTLVNLEILITNKDLADKIYNLKKNSDGLHIKYWNENIIYTILNYDAVILPPIETIKDFRIARKIRNKCLELRIPFYYWSEKWISDEIKRPFVKVVKDYIKTSLIRLASKDANGYIASGSKSKIYLKRYVKVPSELITVAYDSSTSPILRKKENLREKLNLPHNCNLILFLGRLIPRKGCNVLIKAVMPYLDKTNSFLIIAGEGSELRRLRKLACSSSRIIFIGKVQPNYRRNLYEQSNVFVLPSIAMNGVIEAWGLTLNEALECGTPVISTNAVGAAFDLIDNKNGYLVKNNSVKQLSNVLAKALNKKSFKNRKQIMKDYYSKFSVKLMSKNFYKAIFG